MKRLIFMAAVILLAVICFALVSCAGRGEGTGEDTQKTDQSGGKTSEKMTPEKAREIIDEIFTPNPEGTLVLNDGVNWDGYGQVFGDMREMVVYNGTGAVCIYTRSLLDGSMEIACRDETCRHNDIRCPAFFRQEKNTSSDIARMSMVYVSGEGREVVYYICDILPDMYVGGQKVELFNDQEFYAAQKEATGKLGPAVFSALFELDLGTGERRCIASYLPYGQVWYYCNGKVYLYLGDPYRSTIMSVDVETGKTAKTGADRFVGVYDGKAYFRKYVGNGKYELFSADEDNISVPEKLINSGTATAAIMDGELYYIAVENPEEDVPRAKRMYNLYRYDLKAPGAEPRAVAEDVYPPSFDTIAASGGKVYFTYAVHPEGELSDDDNLQYIHTVPVLYRYDAETEEIKEVLRIPDEYEFGGIFAADQKERRYVWLNISTPDDKKRVLHMYDTETEKIVYEEVLKDETAKDKEKNNN